MQQLKDHERRISDLEHNYEKLDIRMSSIENSIDKLENTITREGQDTRNLLNKLVEHNHKMEETKLDNEKYLKQARLTFWKVATRNFFAWLGGIWVLMQVALKLLFNGGE